MPTVARASATVAIDEAAVVPNLDKPGSRVFGPILTDMLGEAWFLRIPKSTNYFKALFDRGAERLERASRQGDCR